MSCLPWRTKRYSFKRKRIEEGFFYVGEDVMNFKLIFLLSLFGLAMAIATVFVIPSSIEPVFWLVILITCAIIIAKKTTERYFLHGFLTCLLNCVWVTSAHLIFFNQYIANHPQEAKMMASAHISPKIMMLVTGPVIGILTGVMLGLFAILASKLLTGKTKNIWKYIVMIFINRTGIYHSSKLDACPNNHQCKNIFSLN